MGLFDPRPLIVVPTLDNLPHARSYLEGIVLDKSLPDPFSNYGVLPEKWDTVRYFDADPDSDLSQDKRTVYTTFNDHLGMASSRAYVAEYSVHSDHLFYYYEVSINTLFCDGGSSMYIMMALVAENQNNDWLLKAAGIQDLLLAPPPAAQVQDDGLPYLGYYKEFVAGASSPPGESTIAAGDILGCGFSRPEGRIFFTKNGTLIGVSQDASKFLSSTMARLRPVVYVALKKHRNIPISPELYLRTTVNFGQDIFAFDIAHFAEGYFKQRRQRFECSAGSLPNEIIAMIAIFAIEIIVAKEDVISRISLLNSLAMVNHTWQTICRPMMFSELRIRSLAELYRLCIIFKTAKISTPPHKVQIGADRYRDPNDDELPVPSLALTLSSVGGHLQQTNNIWYTSCGTRFPPVIQEAPPRIEAAIPALLRPLQHLTHLRLFGMKLRSLAQLLGIIRAQPHIQHIHLDQIGILQATERFFWPPRLVLTDLQYFELELCRVPASSIPIFVSLRLGGKPNFSPLPTGVSQHYPLQPGTSHHSRQIHLDDEKALVQIAQALGRHLCTRHSHPDGAGICKFGVWVSPTLTSGRPFLTLSSYYFNTCVIGTWTENTLGSEGTLWRIKEVSLDLGMLCGMVEGTAHALASLDRSFAAIFTGDNPSLTFSFRIRIGPILFKRITKVVPNPLRLLEEKGRLILEFDELEDLRCLELLEDSEKSDVTGDTPDSEHQPENDEEPDTTPQ